MTLLHIPVRVIASDPAETQAFADVLGGGQAGSLALANAGEKPLAVLVCPSGAFDGDSSLPAVILGSRNNAVPETARVLATPADLSDILEALEVLASNASGLSAPRAFAGWRLEPARLVLRTPDEKVITLTDTESRLLACLIDAQGTEVTRDTLLQRVWGYRPGLDTHTLETHIYRLRKKVEADPANPAFVLTTDAGYRLA